MLSYVRDILVASGHLVDGPWLEYNEILMTSIHGRPLVHRFNHPALRAILHGMDSDLKREDLARLAATRSDVTGNVARGISPAFHGPDGDLLWTMLCMHVGHDVAPEVLRSAERALDWWANCPTRVKLAQAYRTEMRRYCPARHSGRVRFPGEVYLDFCPGASRYLVRQAAGPGFDEADVSVWEPDVLLECSGCSRFKPKAAGSMMACAWCKVACYCNVACQTLHWAQHKKVCARLPAKA